MKLLILVAALMVVMVQSARVPRSIEEVQYPLAHYKDLYARDEEEHKSMDVRQAKDCPAECPAPCEGFHQVEKNEPAGEPCAPLEVGGEKIETESVFYYPIKGSKCCKQRSCVVANCKPIQAKWMYKKGAKCTVDDKPNGKEDECKERVKKYTCGCKVHACDNKKCKATLKCDKCKDNLHLTDKCNCPVQDPAKECGPKSVKNMCNKNKKCPDCLSCTNRAAVQGCEKSVPYFKCTSKPDCPPLPFCKPCLEEFVKLPGTKCCPNQGKCITIVKPGESICSTNGKMQPGKDGKCFNNCQTPVQVSMNKNNPACNKTVTCCDMKKCDQRNMLKNCTSCQVHSNPTEDECGCVKAGCEDHPKIKSCKKDLMEVLVTLKTGGSKSKALSSLPLEDQKKAATNSKVEVTIMGTCAKENVTLTISSEDEKFPLDTPVTLSDSVNKMDTVTKITVKILGDDEWFVEHVKVDVKTDGKQTPGGNKLPEPTTFKVEKWLKTVEPEIELSLECDNKCEKLVNMPHICEKLVMEKCKPITCKKPEVCTDKCKVQVDVPTECGCLVRSCVKPSDNPDAPCPPNPKCPNDKNKRVRVSLPADCGNNGVGWICGMENCCKPEEAVCPKQVTKPVIKCNQCEEEGDESFAPPATANCKKPPAVCKKAVCKERSKCMTKVDAAKILKCEDGCEEPVLSKELAKPCGCKKWKCGPKNQVPCDSKVCDDSCKKCIEVEAKFCKSKAAQKQFKCVKKPCKEAGPCELKKKTNGKPLIDKCGCEKIIPKPCTGTNARECIKGYKLIENAQDGCNCQLNVNVPCSQQKGTAPVCDKCEETTSESQGDCCDPKKVCKPKKCPEDPKPNCKKCETITVHKDTCKCCKSTCSPIKCTPPKDCKSRTCKTEVLTDYPGNDIKDIPAKDVEACKEACKKEDKCKGYTFDKKVLHCWLKSKLEGKTSSGSTTSGSCSEVLVPVLTKDDCGCNVLVECVPKEPKDPKEPKCPAKFCQDKCTSTCPKK